jgi:hypothetical protein
MQATVETAPTGGKGKKLLEQMRDVMRLKHYSYRTEQTYCDWVERFIRFHFRDSYFSFARAEALLFSKKCHCAEVPA